MSKTTNLLWFMKRCFQLMFCYPWLTVASFASLFFYASATASLPLFYKDILNKAAPSKDIQYLHQLILWVLLIFLFIVILRSLSKCFLAIISAQLLFDLKKNMLLNLPCFIRSKGVSVGDIISRFNGDVGLLEKIFEKDLPRCVMGVCIAVLNLLLLFYIKWQMALVVLTLLPFTAVATKLFSREASQASYRKRLDEAAVASTLEENLSARDVISAFGLEQKFERRFLTKIECLKQTTLTLEKYNILMSELTFFCIEGMVIAIVIVGALFISYGWINIGELVAFFMLLLNVSNAANSVGRVLPSIFKGFGSMVRIDELLQQPSTITLPKKPAPSFRNLHFDDVSFAFDGNNKVLQKLNFCVRQGQLTAIVGSSGSGKSTILQILLRLQNLDQGKILWNGKDYKDIDLASVRRQIGVIFQNPVLFTTTIYDNILLGNPQASEDEIIEAAQAAQIHDFIMTLPQGYQTQVGEKGNCLSGGQKQRITIARALVRKPQILFFDEATAALDVKTENSILETLMILKKTHTIIYITHRLSCLEQFDNILVLDKGKIIEQGNHAQLLQNGTWYKSLWEKHQSFGYDENSSSIFVKASLLRKVPVLEGLGNRGLHSLIPHFKEEHIPANQFIIHQGEVGDKFYILVRGKVDILVREHSSSTVVAQMQDGDYFGEIALIKDVPRTASVLSSTPCVLLSLDKTIFHAFMSKNPQLQQKIAQKIPTRQNLKQVL